MLIFYSQTREFPSLWRFQCLSTLSSDADLFGLGGSMAKKINWVAIEKEIEEGRSYRKIAKRHGINHSTIVKRVKAGKLLPKGENWHEPVKLLECAKLPQTPQEKRVAAMGNRDPENAKMILELIARGNSPVLAAQAVGINPKTFKSWVNDDPEFGNLLAQAQAVDISMEEQNVKNASSRGELKATIYRLEHHPLTKKQYGENPLNNQTLIQINIDRDAPTVLGEPPE
jgi:DNA-binding CsgD family transcriptional regulator|tara:strand:- start:4074 stop:4757 length:684 start_codon:yes stop_codon:yes gene_type:complete